MKIWHVVGTRPNFMKVAPVMRALTERSIPQQLIHTGQHYDRNMSDVFFEELNIPQPDFNLEVGSGTQGYQTSQIIIKIERLLLDSKPDWVIVYGDVNSTLATALVCAKLGIQMAHVEAGLRSFDRTMPEEVNRLVTDRLADVLFTPSVDGDRNLAREGISPDRIFFVGNVMIDTLIRLLPRTQQSKILNNIGIDSEEPYTLVTLHRPSNVDNETKLKALFNMLDAISHSIRVVFSVHPRTQKQLKDMALKPISTSFQLINPVSYIDFLQLQKQASVVITDSGGVQEETTYLGVPCLTMRDNTERPITIEVGTNQLIGDDVQRLSEEVEMVLSGNGKRGEIPLLWDGKAAQRIADKLLKLGNN